MQLGDSFNQKYQCDWMRGIAEGTPAYRTESSGKVVENLLKLKMGATPTPHHCVKACLKRKEENSNITGVIVRRNNAMFDCWCFSNTTDVNINYNRDHQSCMLVLKGEIFQTTELFLTPLEEFGGDECNEYL